LLKSPRKAAPSTDRKETTATTGALIGPTCACPDANPPPPPPHCRCRRIFDLDPLLRSTGAVRRAEPLRHDALAAEFAGLPIDDIAVADIVRVERDTGRAIAQQPGQQLLTLFDRQPAHFLVVKLKQVESAQHRPRAATLAAEQVEHSEPGIVSDDRLAVDQAGTCRQRRNGRSPRPRPLRRVRIIHRRASSTTTVR
jgi:hypothetical protein